MPSLWFLLQKKEDFLVTQEQKLGSMEHQVG